MDGGDGFEAFFGEAEPAVRRALVSRFGAELGRDAAAEGFAVAWRSWDRVAGMANRSGYVYRAGERWAQRQRPISSQGTPEVMVVEDRYVDLELAEALDHLSPRQREAVILVAGFGMTHREAAALLGCAKSSIQNHVERGMSRLRNDLEVPDNA